MRVALLNNKGGVGKTTATLGIAEAAAARGARVLVVDMDPQANATRRLGVEPDPGHTLTRCLQLGVRNSEASKYLYPAMWEGEIGEHIMVLPSDLDLEDRTLEAGQPGAHNRLRRALYAVDDGYDLTLIDCPPSIKGHLTTMAIAALDDDVVDAVIVPITPEHDAIAGAQRVIAYVRQYRDDLDVRVDVTGIIVNGTRPTALHGARLAQLAETFPGIDLLGKPIPQRAGIADMMDRARPIGATRDTSTAEAVETYDVIAEHLLGISAQAHGTGV